MEVKGNNTRYETKGLPKGPVPIFEKAGLTPETLLEKIDEYFNTVKDITITVINQGKPTERTVKLFTFPDLCLYLGFDSRQGYLKIMRNEKNVYSSSLKKGYTKLQSYFEKQSMLMGNPAGPLFILKNMDYSDNQTVNNISTDGSMSPAPAIISHSNEHDKDTASEVRKMIKDLERKEQVEIEK